MSDEFVTVECTLPSGITIDSGDPGKNYMWVHVPGPDLKRRVAGSARVPTAMWELWLNRNKKSRLVRDGSVRVRK